MDVGCIGFHNEDDLNESTSRRLPPNDPLVITPNLRIGRSGINHHMLSLQRLNAVLGNVRDVFRRPYEARHGRITYTTKWQVRPDARRQLVAASNRDNPV